MTFDDVTGTHSIQGPGTHPRGKVWHTAARDGRGSFRQWSRTINGQTFGFVLVLMPDREVRWAVTKYNGYIDPRFACAWSGPRNWTFRPCV